MTITRRALLAGAAGTGLAGLSACAAQDGARGIAQGTAPGTAQAGTSDDTPGSDTPLLPVRVAARSPWMANGVTLTSDNILFLGCPRWPGHENTPSLVRREADGSVKPFPGNAWNRWAPGDDGLNAFVYVNSVHVFADDTLWCVDWGAKRGEIAKPGAQKLVQFDPRTGRVLQLIRFPDAIAPPGSEVNDLRLFGNLIYMTESGLGALIVHDTSTGSWLRRMSGFKEMVGGPDLHPVAPKPGQGVVKHKTPKADLIEISPDGAYLYWASPTGPFRRIATALLRDTSISDEQLATHVETVFQTTLVGGSAMDTLGNLYLSDIHNRRTLLRAPDGREVVLAADPGFFSPDAAFISRDRRLYTPAPQIERTALFGHPDETQAPFITYVVDLPRSFAGIPLGDAITGGPAA